MRNWVEIDQGIPFFLASVTLECYDKWRWERKVGGAGQRGGVQGGMGLQNLGSISTFEHSALFSYFL
jgi:hypothetical protein